LLKFLGKVAEKSAAPLKPRGAGARAAFAASPFVQVCFVAAAVTPQAFAMHAQRDRDPGANGPPGASFVGVVWLAMALVPPLSGCQALRLSSEKRPWSPDQAVLASAEIDGDEITVRNIRDCVYRTADDYTVRYYDRTIRLEEIQRVDFIVVPFAEMPSLAHTMLSFGLVDGSQIAVSVEVRKRVGDSYAPLLAMLPLYELMYVVGDERDLIALRTNHRLDEVYLYRTRATPQQAQSLFLDVMERVNKLAERPEYYNTLANNCTTNIRRHVMKLVPGGVPYDYRVLLPGYSDRLAYDLGLLETEASFEETRRRARVNYLANRYRHAPDFSARIRGKTGKEGEWR
jgi:hypothetical protein